MTRLEFIKYLRKNSVNSPDNFNFADKSPLSLPFDNIEYVGQGIFNKVYKVNVGGDYWIIKEGRYDLSLPVLKSAWLPLPKSLVAWVYSLFNVKIMPTHEAALEQFSEYVLLSRYFGFFHKKAAHSVVGFDPTIIETQRSVRSALKQSILEEDEFAEIVLASVKSFRNYHKIRDIVSNNKYLNSNFLPKEYLILSTSSGIKRFFKKLTKRRETYYIVQDLVEGDPLSKITDAQLVENTELISRMIVFILLSLYMVFHESRIIDSRPEGMLSGINDWFGKTGNIIVQLEKSDLKFIDTRWLHNKDGNLIQRTILAPELIQEAMSKYLQKYVDMIA